MIYIENLKNYGVYTLFIRVIFWADPKNDTI